MYCSKCGVQLGLNDFIELDFNRKICLTCWNKRVELMKILGIKLPFIKAC